MKAGVRFHTYETARVLFPIKLEGNEGWVDGTSHVLKLHILSGQMAVEFAGEPRLACGPIAELKSDIEPDPTATRAASTLLHGQVSSYI
jgi:hypothetical protein